MDLLVKQGDTYWEVAIDEAESAQMHMLAYDDEIVKQWVELSCNEKKDILKDYYTLFAE